MAKNPYSNIVGCPLPAKEKEFFAWAHKAEQRRIAKLPAAEQAKIRKSDLALSKRMDS